MRQTRCLVAVRNGSDAAAAADPEAKVLRSSGACRAPSTLLGGVVLGYPGQLVEIEAVAAATPGAGPRA